MTVHLVGAGPGDPELLTRKAARLLRSADVVVHDRLVGDEILAMAPPWAELIDVGKNPNGHRTTQTEINRILIDRGRRFEHVVRLKGGDPFIFGRGGEEAIDLRAAGIDVTVVPGISSSIAGPAAAGIPVTHRGVASGFTVVTAHEDPANDNGVNWDALATLNTTIVVLMGARRAGDVRDRLVAGGMREDTPVATVVKATTTDQQTDLMTLADLGRQPVPNPAILVIGDVAAHPVIPEQLTNALEPISLTPHSPTQTSQTQTSQTQTSQAQNSPTPETSQWP